MKIEKGITNKQIKEVLTKEQYDSLVYQVKGDE